MKLEGIHDGSIYVSSGRRIGRVDPQAGFEPVGTLPRPPAFFDALRSAGPVRTGLQALVGRFPTTNCWWLTGDVLLATHGRYVWRSDDGGTSWQHVHLLPPDSGPMGVLPTAVCEHRGKTYLAEYSLGNTPATILVSEDSGSSWGQYVTTNRRRHFHGVFADPYSDTVWATAGDTDEESAIGRLRDGSFEPIGGGSQAWRAVDLAFTPTAIVWGMDCAYADRVDIYYLKRSAIGTGTPTKIHQVDASVYYLATVRTDEEIWIAAATQAEIGVDRTAGSHNGRATGDIARVWVASDRTDFRTWHVVARYRRRRVPADWFDRLPSANGYVYLAGDPHLGLVINPYSVGATPGRLHHVDPARLRSLGLDADGRPTVSTIEGNQTVTR